MKTQNASMQGRLRMALDRVRLLEDDIAAGVVDEAYLREFCANMRLRIEHGAPVDTIACFAKGGG